MVDPERERERGGGGGQGESADSCSCPCLSWRCRAGLIQTAHNVLNNTPALQIKWINTLKIQKQ